jgi:hypothetical protein
MPVISMFYGILIYMYYSDTGQHRRPHIHAEYGGYEAVIALSGELLAGELPKKQLTLVLAWLSIHIEELEANWKLATRNETVFKIDPLK